MGYENTAGLNVSNQYGARFTGGTIGVERSVDSTQQLSIAFTADSLINGYPKATKVFRGAHFLRFTLRVDEIFTMTGTTPTVIFGGTAPATNGIVLTAAELNVVGTKIPASTGTGTWAVGSTTGTTATETVTSALGGTTPVVTPGAGKATLIAEFLFKTKV
jgi:hypothetical protein